MALYFFIIIIIKFDLNIVVWKTSKKVLHFSNLIIEIRTNDMNRTNDYSFFMQLYRNNHKILQFLILCSMEKVPACLKQHEGSK